MGWEPACADPCFTCITIVRGCYITSRQPMSSRQTERRCLMGEVNGRKVRRDLHMSWYNFPLTEIMNMTAVNYRRDVEKLPTDYAAHFREESHRNKRERVKEKEAPSVTLYAI